MDVLLSGYKDNYGFEDVDRDVIGEFKKAKHPNQVVVALHFIDFPGDKLTERILEPRYKSVFMVDQ